MSDIARRSGSEVDPMLMVVGGGGLALFGLELVTRTATAITGFLQGHGWSLGPGGRGGSFVLMLLAGKSPSEAWRRIGGSMASPMPGWLFWPVLGSLLLLTAVGAVVSWRLAASTRSKKRKETEAHWATRRDEQPMTVADAPESRHHRIVVGRSKSTRRLLAAHDCVSAVVFGPNGSGKTVGLIIPNVLEWSGSVVMTTAKPHDLIPVLARRSSLGPVWVVAPGGAPGVTTSCWSPVDYAADPESADRMAEWLVDASGMTGDPKARPWNAQARKYLKGLLLAANLSGGGISKFVEWAYAGELARERVEQVLAENGHTAVLREYGSTWQIHDEGRGSVLFTAFGLADTYNRPTVRAAADHSDFSPGDLFGDRSATVLLVTPQSESDRFTPYFTALISSIVHEAEDRAASVGGPVDPRLLLALDEAGNVFRYPRLPHLLTTGRGNGVQLLLAYHDIAQIEHLYGGRDVARTVLSNAKMRVLLPGVGDIDTLRYFGDLLGHTRVSLRSEQTGPDGRRSRSRAEQREALAPLHTLQQLPDSEAIVLYQNLPPARVRLRRWFDDKALRQLSETS